MSEMPLSPPPVDSLQVVRISSLTAALAKLNIKIPIEDVIKAIHDEDTAERAQLTATQATQWRVALSKIGDGDITAVSEFIPNPAKPTNVDPLAKERRRRLLELTKESFPDGNITN